MRWRLDDFGRSAVASLGQALPDDLADVVWSSHEARGQETAEQLIESRGADQSRLELRLDPDLREVGRPTAWSSTYAEDLAGYFRDGAGDGWEPATSVLSRVSGVVDRAVREASGLPVVVVTHGLALSLYVGASCGVRPAGFLQSLMHPDAWLLDLEAGRLERLDPDDATDEAARLADPLLDGFDLDGG